jgi:serine/threonine protein kinase
VRLTDFGLARAAADAAMTHSGLVAGTPHYMAPEQARGETADPRADLFSLGSTLYAICAGHPPFRAESPLAVLRRVCDDDPRPLREQNPDVPAWLETIIARLLAKDRVHRFQTASEVAELLGRCLAHVQQPLTSPLPDGLEHNSTTQKPANTLRRSAGAVALVTMIALAAGALVVWSRGQMPDRSSEPTASPSSAVSSEQPPDEIGLLLDDAANRAQALQHEFLAPRNDLHRDLILDRTAALFQQAEALERDIVSGRALPDNFSDILSNPKPSNRR